MFWMKIFIKYNNSPIYAIFYDLFIYLSSFIYNIFIIVHYFYDPLYYAFQILQPHLKSQLFPYIKLCFSTFHLQKLPYFLNFLKINQRLATQMLFAIWIIIQSTRKRAIIEKFLSLSTRKNIESLENILLKIFNSHRIVEFKGAAPFRPSRCEVVTVILTDFRRNSRRAIQSRAIHCTEGGTLVVEKLLVGG